MKRITIYIVFALLCLNFRVKAQSSIKEIKPLQVGSKLPESYWQLSLATINSIGQKDILQLNSVKGKHQLIAFWACWCGSCITKFSFLDSIQQQYGAKLKVIPVNTLKTGDTEQRIQDLISGNRHKHISLKMPTVIGDSVMDNYFPHTSVPYYVWIDNKGMVKAITMSVLLKAQNIKMFLEDEL
ncbi:MAG: TlpA family protein disulfide reductase [Chryseobacterium sp.]|nr:MAG: TlpA family protein disulfide reductase [Chryseobacterium sp.]